MSKQEVIKIQTCVLKVHIHCDGCKQKVKKLLQKIDGVYTTTIDAEQGKVTVSGNVDPSTLIKKLGKSGKHAEIWGSKPSNNQHQKMQNENGKVQKDGKGQKGKHEQQQLMKGFKNLKLPQLKDLKLPFKEQKTVKFNLPEYGDDLDDDHDMFDEFYDDADDEFGDCEYDDDFDDEHVEQLKAHFLKDATMKSMNDHGMNDSKDGGNGKKGGGSLDAQNKGMGVNHDAKNGKGGKMGGGNQNQGGVGGGAKNGGKNCGNNKAATNVSGGNNNESTNGAKSNVGHGLPGMHVTEGSGFGGLNLGQMGNIPAVQGLPAMNAGGYFRGAGPEFLPGNPYHQQYVAAMMSHQRPIYNGQFQPIEYSRATPATAYYEPLPQPYGHQHIFSDDIPSSCSVM